MYLWWWLLIWFLSIICMGEWKRTSDFWRTNYKNEGNRIIFWESHYQINVCKRQEIQSHLKESRWLSLPAGLECTFLNVSVYPKHECAVVELTSCGRTEKGELVHTWWQGTCKHNPVGSEKECFKTAMLITRPLWADTPGYLTVMPLALPFIWLPWFWLSAHRATFWL